MSVTIFLVLAGGLLLLALLVLLRPLWQTRLLDTDRLDLNKTLYRERAVELEQLLATGMIDVAEKQRRDAENARRLLSDADSLDGGGVGSSLRKPLVLLLVLLVPALAVLMYWQLGNYQQVRAWQSLESVDVSNADRNMVDMLLLLRTRLHDDPEDIEGWYLLGRSYLSMQRAQEALQAFDHARKLAPDEPDYLVAYAQTLRLAEQDAALPEIDRLLRQALQLDANHEGARLLTAYRDMEQGRYQDAINSFLSLRQNRASDSESVAMLDKVIAEAEAALSAAGSARATAPAQTDSRQSNAAPTVASKPTAGQGQGGTQPPAATGDNLTVQVKLAPALLARLKAGARVFVFARGENGPGLPVAVAVLPASSLPATVTLSDANAMNPSAKLSDQQRVTLVARVSMAGSVEPAAGDLQGKLPAFDWRQQPEQSLLIDSVL